MKKKRLFAFVLAAVVLVLSACSQGTKDNVEKTDTGVKNFKVAVVQIVQHPALDAATKGFQEELTNQLGDAVTFEVQNASGEVANLPTIVNGFISEKVDLILANGTPALQAAAGATSEIPILGTSITDFGVALGIEDFNGTPGNNVSGTSDLAPMDRTADLFTEWFPDAKKVGIIFSSSEANSAYQVEKMTSLLEAKGYTVTPYAFTDSNDLGPVVSLAAAESDVIYEPTDNTASSNAEAIANIVLPAGIPVITGEEAPCAVFGVATVSIDYTELGRETGRMAAEILLNKTPIEQMAVRYAPEAKKMVNEKIAGELGLTIPEGYEVIEGTEVR